MADKENQLDEEEPQKRRLSLSLKGRRGQKRFAEVSADNLVASKLKPTSKNTERSQTWALNVFRSWIAASETGSGVADSILWEGDPKDVCTLLCQFIKEARQQSGEPYCPKTLLQILSNLQGFALSKNPHAPHFMNHKDPVFMSLHNVLNNESRRLLNEGIGAVKKQARVITVEEEEKLWDTGVMGTHSPLA
uniref:DUF3504 domain-containing protein n=1 Tax=Amphimedon queenslandica TaxID=400682 RepID=A0A1X7TFH8_AMPQE